MMGDLNPYFSRKEFACKCGCGFDTIDAETLKVITQVREFFGAPVTINSACRCPEHNKKVGGGEKSQHLFGRACDIEVKGVKPQVVATFIESLYPEKYGLGKYNTFTHIDTRSSGLARWRG